MTEAERTISASVERIAAEDSLASECGCDPITAHMALNLGHGDRDAARLILETVQLAESEQPFTHWHSVALTIAWELHWMASPCCGDGEHRPSPEQAAGFVQRQFAILEARERKRPGWLTRLLRRNTA